MHQLTSLLEAGAATHAGRVREQNEDSYLVSSKAGVWAVADGMGGHMAGDVASRMIVEELGRITAPLSAAQLLADCEASLMNANHRLIEIADQRGGATIGSTVAVLMVYADFFACVWAGDSRIYRIRGDQIAQVSIDHSEVQSLVDEGRITPQEAKSWPRRNVITRAIGIYDSPELEMKSGTLEPNDIFVLCSDGLTNHVEDDEIRDIVMREVPQQACDQLVALTLDRGATDNVTVVVVSKRRASSTTQTRIFGASG